MQEEVGLQNQEEENQGKKSGSVFPGLLLSSRKFWGVPEYAQYVFLPFKVNMYWASSTPATLALTHATAASSMDRASCAYQFKRRGRWVARASHALALKPTGTPPPAPPRPSSPHPSPALDTPREAETEPCLGGVAWSAPEARGGFPQKPRPNQSENRKRESN